MSERLNLRNVSKHRRMRAIEQVFQLHRQSLENIRSAELALTRRNIVRLVDEQDAKPTQDPYSQGNEYLLHKEI